MPILGTFIAFGIAAAAQIVTLPQVAVELDQDVEVQTVVAREMRSAEYITDTEAKVREYFRDMPIMVSVAYCESRFTHVDNTTGQVIRGRVNSNDVGVMQINQRYHGDTAESLGLDLLDFEDNLAYARVLYEQQGTQPWSASRPCWGPQTLAMR